MRKALLDHLDELGPDNVACLASDGHQDRHLAAGARDRFARVVVQQRGVLFVKSAQSLAKDLL